MDDADLVAAARRGDDSAWAGIYDRYADRLHDHCHRILRDRDEAADALHDAFLAASRNLEQLRDPTRLRPWLYAICRHTSLRRLKARDRVELTDTPDEMMAPEGEPDRGVRQEELAELVWAAAAGLNGRDQALLDLNLRQGLEGQDLADAMGTTLNNSYVMLSRLRDQVERSLGALLIARLGREDCKELDGLLKDWDGKFSPLLRKRVARHVDGCEACSEKKKSVASPLALLGLAPLVPAPSLLKARVISSIRNVETIDPPYVRFTSEGFAAMENDVPARKIRGAWLATAAAVLLLLGGFFLAGQGDDDPKVQTAASEQTDSTAGTRRRVTTTTLEDLTTSTTDDETESADNGAASEDDDEDGGSGTDDTPGTTATTRPGDTTSSTVRDTTSTTAAVPVEITDFRLTSRSINTQRCADGPYTTTGTAFVSGNPSKVRLLLLREGDNQILPMSDSGGGKWTYTFGPYATGDAPLDIRIQAFVEGRRDSVWKWDVVIPVNDCASTTQPPTNSVPGRD